MPKHEVEQTKTDTREWENKQQSPKLWKIAYYVWKKSWY